jgi:hypothetical protein
MTPFHCSGWRRCERRRRFKQVQTLEERLAEFAAKSKGKAKCPFLLEERAKRLFARLGRQRRAYR